MSNLCTNWIWCWYKSKSWVVLIFNILGTIKTVKSLLLGFCYSLISQITAQKMKFSTKDFFRKCDQILSLLRIWSHLLKKSLMENFIFCAVDHAQSLMIKLAMFWFDADVSFLKSKGKSNSYISQLFESWGTKLCLTTTF